MKININLWKKHVNKIKYVKNQWNNFLTGYSVAQNIYYQEVTSFF